MSEAKNVFSEICISCVLIVIGIVSVVSMAVLIWNQFI